MNLLSFFQSDISNVNIKLVTRYTSICAPIYQINSTNSPSAHVRRTDICGWAQSQGCAKEAPQKKETGGSVNGLKASHEYINHALQNQCLFSLYSIVSSSCTSYRSLPSSSSMSTTLRSTSSRTPSRLTLLRGSILGQSLFRTCSSECLLVFTVTPAVVLWGREDIMFRTWMCNTHCVFVSWWWEMAVAVQMCSHLTPPCWAAHSVWEHRCRCPLSTSTPSDKSDRDGWWRGGEGERRLPLRRLLRPDEEHNHSRPPRHCHHSTSGHPCPRVEDLF